MLGSINSVGFTFSLEPGPGIDAVMKLIEELEDEIKALNDTIDANNDNLESKITGIKVSE